MFTFKSHTPPTSNLPKPTTVDLGALLSSVEDCQRIISELLSHRSTFEPFLRSTFYTTCDDLTPQLDQVKGVITAYSTPNPEQISGSGVDSSGRQFHIIGGNVAALHRCIREIFQALQQRSATRFDDRHLKSKPGVKMLETQFAEAYKSFNMHWDIFVQLL